MRPFPRLNPQAHDFLVLFKVKMRCTPVFVSLSLVACSYARALHVNPQVVAQPLVQEEVSEQVSQASSRGALLNSSAHVVANAAAAAEDDPAYWLANIAHKGVAAFNSNPSGYTVFRNVKDYGAKGNPPKACTDNRCH